MDVLQREVDGRAFRLIGIGASDLVEGEAADQPDLLDTTRIRQVQVEQAIDSVREKLGTEAIRKGRGLIEDR